MLVLTRKIDESIIIEGNIAVTVLGVDRDRVKIGIAAPSGASVLREELVKAAQQAQTPATPGRDAVTPTPQPLRLPANLTSLRATPAPAPVAPEKAEAHEASATVRRRFEKRHEMRVSRLHSMRASA